MWVNTVARGVRGSTLRLMPGSGKASGQVRQIRHPILGQWLLESIQNRRPLRPQLPQLPPVPLPAAPAAHFLQPLQQAAQGHL